MTIFGTRKCTAFSPPVVVRVGSPISCSPTKRAKEQELEADDKGFIYAGMAGYPVETLVKNRAGKPDFFAFWMQQTNARVQSVHASTGDRAALLQQRLQELQNKLGFFEFGVRLSHFDYCDDAVYFFQEFQKTFPGREVLNNLGYCYLQLARQEMDPQRAYFYWLPLILDGETRAQPLLRASRSMLKTLRQAASNKAEGLLNDAVDYLKQARDADPSYLPARLNLAVAYLYLGQPQQAAAVLAEARELAADDLTIQGAGSTGAIRKQRCRARPMANRSGPARKTRGRFGCAHGRDIQSGAASLGGFTSQCGKRALE